MQDPAWVVLQLARSTRVKIACPWSERAQRLFEEKFLDRLIRETSDTAHQPSNSSEVDGGTTRIETSAERSGRDEFTPEADTLGNLRLDLRNPDSGGP